MTLLFAASQQAKLHGIFAMLVAGFVVGVFGHITRIRWLVVLGIVGIGAASVLFCVFFAFDLTPGGP